MGSIIGWIIFGAIAGGIAKLIMPGKDPGGFIITILLGIAGALVGGYIGRALWGSAGVNSWSIGSFALAIGGAILLLLLYRLLFVRKGTASAEGNRDKWAA
ncbi:MAG TPA: GlsB/YeaQ/YmgE family stress response membrane protein [Terriglobales bacterium]|nr:GlsB/YeaQ/YmgE family stress response membrane protein [Terriglobales bacterium]